jgi:hypothetical protein
VQFLSLRSICVLAILLSAETCQAGTITAELTGTTNNGAPTVSINDGSGSATLTPYNFAGYINWTLKSNNSSSAILPTFNSFCIELTQDVNIGGTYTYAIAALEDSPSPGSAATGGPSGMGSVKADALRRLWGGFYSDTMSKNDAAAFQLAIWKIEYDGIASTISDFSHGNFRASSTTSAVITTATQLYNNVVTNVYDESLAASNLIALSDPVLQDQITYTGNSPGILGTPEPSTLCLGVIGGVAFGAARYRRRRPQLPIS